MMMSSSSSATQNHQDLSRSLLYRHHHHHRRRRRQSHRRQHTTTTTTTSVFEDVLFFIFATFVVSMMTMTTADQQVHGFTIPSVPAPAPAPTTPIQGNSGAVTLGGGCGCGARRRPLSLPLPFLSSPSPSPTSTRTLLKSSQQDNNTPQPILSFDDDDDDEDDDDDIFGMINDCGEGGSSDFDDDDDGDLDWFRFASIDELYSPPPSDVSQQQQGGGGGGQQSESDDNSQGQNNNQKEDVLERLQASTVAIVGVGGVGTWAAEALCRSGVGHFVLVDLDDVCVSQTTSSLSSLKSNVGKFKTDTLRQRLLDIHPTVKVTIVNDFVKVGDNVDEIVSKQFVHSEHKVDLVIDTIDNVADRVALWSSCCKQGIKIITTGNPGGRKDPTKIQVSTLSRQDTITDEWLVQAREYISKNYADSNSARNNEDGNGTEDCSLKLMDNVLCVHSNEVPVKGPFGAECLGSVCFVSGTFGFIAASQAIEKLLEPRPSSSS